MDIYRKLMKQWLKRSESYGRSKGNNLGISFLFRQDRDKAHARSRRNVLYLVREAERDSKSLIGGKRINLLVINLFYAKFIFNIQFRICWNFLFFKPCYDSTGNAFRPRSNSREIKLLFSFCSTCVVLTFYFLSIIM